jgi:xanthine dehydrogenase YagS FAD-binding subunit
MIPRFSLARPRTLEEAWEALAAAGGDGAYYAGGTELLQVMKMGLAQFGTLIDLKGIEELHGIAGTEDGSLRIGGAATHREIERSPIVRERLPALARLEQHVANVRVRNQGTLGGNVAQDTRCWYYRSGWTCYRAGGNICYADTPTSINREHALFDANRCVAVNPSDTAPALVALDAQMVIRNSDGERVVSAEEFFIGPSEDITRMTVMVPGDLLTAVRIPATWAGAKFYFEKVRDRQVWDFPLVNVASAVKLSGGNIQQARIVVNAVAAHPMRLRNVEDAVAGKALTEETAKMAGDLAVTGAQPLAHNGYKIPLMRNLVKRALRAEATS